MHLAAPPGPNLMCSDPDAGRSRSLTPTDHLETSARGAHVLGDLPVRYCSGCGSGNYAVPAK